MKKIKQLIVSIALVTQLCAQTKIDSATKAKIVQDYKLALQYKDGTGVPIDYSKAVGYFQQAANLGDAQSMYALAYMQYKGFGCTQDYPSAAATFANGAYVGRENSMYFYALCLRNGYGVGKNEDSAKYWLVKADSLGYKQAKLELKMMAGENGNDSAKALVQQINNAAIPNNTPLNKFTKIFHSIPTPNMMPGKYIGWLVQYDWSGQNVVSAKRLMFSVKKENDKFSGSWVEGTDTAAITAVLNFTSLNFDKSKYKRKDHYSPDSAVTYDFTNASLTMVQQGDSLYLAGNVIMFSPERKEPSKPLFVALSRKIESANVMATLLTASPNPFVDVLRVDFQLGQPANVEIQLVSLNGTITYQNAAGALQAGHYQLPLQPGFIAAGAYFLKLICNGQLTGIKVVKQ